ncbi:hypothetical protein EC9_31390 [Rosistilla ulvae]|uniref:Uncharacterized protein n=1 Tax=Rosistilla ulvae TaxID=1930277 RepID=A0A517M240_9BACT|nr:hypothetical protein EC9_31390 [Rosistilla ulvae]
MTSRIYFPAFLRSRRVWFPTFWHYYEGSGSRAERFKGLSTLLWLPCLSRLNFRAFHLQPPYCHFACLGLSRYRFVHRASRLTDRRLENRLTSWSSSGRCVRSEVRELLGRSPTGLAETSSFCYGLLILLRLLSTFSVENAVTFGYGAVTTSPIGTFTRQFNRLRRRTSSGRKPRDECVTKEPIIHPQIRRQRPGGAGVGWPGLTRHDSQRPHPGRRGIPANRTRGFRPELPTWTPPESAQVPCANGKHIRGIRSQCRCHLLLCPNAIPIDNRTGRTLAADSRGNIARS